MRSPRPRRRARSSAIARLTYPYCSARGPSRSSATRRISSARPRPTRRESLAIGPPPGTTPVPTSNWPSSVFSREANRRSQASTNSLPAPRARPRIEAMLTAGARDSRTRRSSHACIPVGPTPNATVLRRVVLDVVVGEVEVGVRAVEDDDVEVGVRFDQADELGELGDGRRRDRVDRRVVERHPAVARALAGDPQMRPGPRPGVGTVGVVGGAGVGGAHRDATTPLTSAM